MTPLASSGSAQSSLASPAAAVSPETPALTIFTSCPRALQRLLELGGKGFVLGKAESSGQTVAEGNDHRRARHCPIAMQGTRRRAFPTAIATMAKAPRFIFWTSLPFFIPHRHAI